MDIRFEGQVCKVIEVESKAGLWFALWLTLVMPLQSSAQSAFDGQWRIDDSLTVSTAHYDYLLKNCVFRCLTCDPSIEVKADGRDQAVTGNACYDTVSVSVLDERTILETDKKNGTTVGTLRFAVTGEGDTATEDWTESCNAEGDVLTGSDIMKRVEAAPHDAHAISGSWKITKRVSRSENTLNITLKLTADEFSFLDPAGQGYIAKLDGTETSFRGSLGDTMVSVRRVNERTVEQTDIRNGHAVEITRFTISSDGKTLNVSEEDLTKESVRQFVLRRK